MLYDMLYHTSDAVLEGMGLGSCASTTASGWPRRHHFLQCDDTPCCHPLMG